MPEKNYQTEGELLQSIEPELVFDISKDLPVVDNEVSSSTMNFREQLMQLFYMEIPNIDYVQFTELSNIGEIEVLDSTKRFLYDLLFQSPNFYEENILKFFLWESVVDVNELAERIYSLHEENFDYEEFMNALYKILELIEDVDEGEDNLLQQDEEISTSTDIRAYFEDELTDLYESFCSLVRLSDEMESLMEVLYKIVLIKILLRKGSLNIHEFGYELICIDQKLAKQGKEKLSAFKINPALFLESDTEFMQIFSCYMDMNSGINIPAFLKAKEWMLLGY